MTTIILVGKTTEVHIIRIEDDSQKLLAAIQHHSLTQQKPLDEILNMLGFYRYPQYWRCLPNGADMILVYYDRSATTDAEQSIPAPQPLTVRQQQVLQFLSQGLTTRQIAYQLKIHPNTVAEHIRMIKQRLGAETRAEFLTKAAASGLVNLPSEEHVD